MLTGPRKLSGFLRNVPMESLGVLIKGICMEKVALSPLPFWTKISCFLRTVPHNTEVFLHTL